MKYRFAVNFFCRGQTFILFSALRVKDVEIIRQEHPTKVNIYSLTKDAKRVGFVGLLPLFHNRHLNQL